MSYSFCLFAFYHRKNTPAVVLTIYALGLGEIMRLPEAGPEILVIKVDFILFRKIFANILKDPVILIRATKKRRSKCVEFVFVCERQGPCKPRLPAGQTSAGCALISRDIPEEIRDVVFWRNKLEAFGFKKFFRFFFSPDIFRVGMNVRIIEKPRYSEIIFFRFPERFYGTGCAAGMEQ